MTSSSSTSGKPRTNTYIAILLGLVILGLLAFLLFRVDQMEREFSYLRDNKSLIEQQISTAEENFKEKSRQNENLERQRAKLRSDVDKYEAKQGLIKAIRADISKAEQNLKGLQEAARRANKLIADSANAVERREATLKEEAKIKDQVEALNSKLSQLKSDAREATDNAKKENSALKILKREVARLGSQKQELEAEVTSYQSTKRQLTSVEEDLKAAQKELSEAQSKAESEKRRVNNAASRLAGLRGDIEQAEKNRETATAARGREQSKLAALQTDVRILEQKIDDSRKIEADLSGIEEILTKKRAELDQVTANRNKENDASRKLKAKNGVAQSVLIARKTELARLDTDVAAKNRELDRATKALSSTRSDIAGLKIKQATLVKGFEKLRAEVKAKQYEFAQAQTDLINARVQRARFETKEGELAEIKANFAERTKEKTQLEAEIVGKRAELLAADNKLATAIRARDIARAAETDALILSKKKAALVGDIQTLSGQLSQANSNLKALNEKIGTTQQDLDDKRNKISALRGELRQESGRLDTANRILSDLRAKNAIIVSELGNFEQQLRAAENALSLVREDLGKARDELANVQVDRDKTSEELRNLRTALQKEGPK